MLNNIMIVIIIPSYSTTSGGIKRMLRLLEQLYIRQYDVSLHCQKCCDGLEHLPVPVTFGNISNCNLSNQNTIITYSDDPHINDCFGVSNNVLVYQLSYGMAIDRERTVVSSGATVLCSTDKIRDAVISDGYEATTIGFALDETVQNFYIENYDRKYITIMYHRSPAKNYTLACDAVDELDLPTIVFGQRPVEKIQLPKNCKEIYFDCNSATIRDIFNRSKLYLMPSESEGLNLTPLEAMLCGCNSVLCNGANFYSNLPCTICNTDKNELIRMCKYSIYHDAISNQASNSKIIDFCQSHTWDKVINNMRRYL